MQRGEPAGDDRNRPELSSTVWHLICRYVEMSRSCQEGVDGIMANIENWGLEVKKHFREIDRELVQEIKVASERGRGHQTIFPSFIGMQLKRHMKLGVAGSKEETDPKQFRDMVKRSNKRLKESIRSFLSSLEGILVI